jgi:hypothetical protein
VALLFQGVSTAEIMKVTKAPRRKYQLDPKTGFETSNKKRLKARWLSIPVVVLALVIANGVGPTKEEPDAEIKTKECFALPYPVELSRKEVSSKGFMLAGESFRFSMQPKLGGLFQVRIRRVCDNKLFEAKAWLTKDGLAITKLN